MRVQHIYKTFLPVGEVVQIRWQVGNIFHCVKVIFSHHLLARRCGSIVNDGSPSVWRRDEQDKLIISNVVSNSAVWEVDTSQVIEVTALPEKHFLVRILIVLVTKVLAAFGSRMFLVEEAHGTNLNFAGHIVQGGAALQMTFSKGYL